MSRAARLLAVLGLLGGLLAGCLTAPPLVGPAPQPPAPAPPAPRPPQPAPEAGAVPYAQVAQVKAGIDRAALVALLGRQPSLERPAPTGAGEQDLGWPAVGKGGEARLLVVRLGADGKVVSAVLF